MTDHQKTIVEQLDAAQTGEQFGAALMGLFAALDQTDDEEPAE